MRFSSYVDNMENLVTEGSQQITDVNGANTSVTQDFVVQSHGK